MPDLSELKRQLHILKLATGSELKMVDDEPVKTFLSKNGIDKKGTKYQVRRESLERFKMRVDARRLKHETLRVSGSIEWADGTISTCYSGQIRIEHSSLRNLGHNTV